MQKMFAQVRPFMVQCTNRNAFVIIGSEDRAGRHGNCKEFMVIQLVLVYCLSADRLSCIEKRPIPEFPLSVMGCMIGAQPTALDFLREHPNYELSSWRCEINKPAEKSA